MSPRRRQRARRRRTSQVGPPQHIESRALDEAARRLLTTHDLAELQTLVKHSRETCTGRTALDIRLFTRS